MKNYKLYSAKNQAGMTLIELTVVLLVLIGLAGLMIPYVLSFVQKTHDSTGSNNLAQLNGAIVRYENSVGNYPSNFESLVDTGGAIYGDMMNTSLFTVLNLNTAQAASLSNAGITEVIPMNLSPTSATFSASDITNQQTIGNGINVAALNSSTTSMMMPTSTVSSLEEHLQRGFGKTMETACYTYVAFGIGAESDLIGTTINDAPVHFAGNQKDMGPDDRYNRFIAVFKVDTADSGTNSSLTGEPCSQRVEDAKFVGTAMAMMPGHIYGLNTSLTHAYENLNDELSAN